MLIRQANALRPSVQVFFAHKFNIVTRRSPRIPPSSRRSLYSSRIMSGNMDQKPESKRRRSPALPRPSARYDILNANALDPVFDRSIVLCSYHQLTKSYYCTGSRRRHHFLRLMSFPVATSLRPTMASYPIRNTRPGMLTATFTVWQQ
jgi:hypothetical protein